MAAIQETIEGFHHSGAIDNQTMHGFDEACPTAAATLAYDFFKIKRDEMSIEAINAYASKMTILGWFIGLAYYNWFAHRTVHVPIWGHALLVVVGMFAASIIIGAGMALIAGAITRTITGKLEGSPHVYSWAAFISPVLAFFAADYAVRLFA
jgi:hypothetical protein